MRLVKDQHQDVGELCCELEGISRQFIMLVRDGMLTVVKRLREPCVSRFSSRLGEARAGNRTLHCFGVVSRFQVWNHARVDRE